MQKDLADGGPVATDCVGGSAETRALQSDVIDRAVRGERQAQAEVLEEYHPYVHRMLFRLVGPVADLDDLRQDTIIRIIQGLPGFRGESTITTWIGGICVNVAKEYLRERRQRANRAASSLIEHRQPNALDTVRNLESRHELGRALTALTALSAEQREAFLLKIYGHSVEEIAHMTGAAQSTTRLRLYFGRKRFFRAMEVSIRRRTPTAPQGATP